MGEHPDLRAEADRTPGPYRAPDISNGEVRNVYRRADGSLRYGPAWRDLASAAMNCEPLPGETLVERRDTRFEQIGGAAMAVPAQQPSPTDRVALAGAARAKGYTGEFCPQCQSPNTRRNGSCLVCDNCLSTTGCS